MNGNYVGNLISYVSTDGQTDIGTDIIRCIQRSRRKTASSRLHAAVEVTYRTSPTFWCPPFPPPPHTVNCEVVLDYVILNVTDQFNQCWL